MSTGPSSGANGSGKSLLADALRGRLPLVQGELRYHFRPPPGLTPEEAISHVSFEDRKAEVHDTVVQSRWNSLEEEGASLVRDFLSYERVMEINPFEVTSRHRPGAAAVRAAHAAGRGPAPGRAVARPAADLPVQRRAAKSPVGAGARASRCAC